MIGRAWTLREVAGTVRGEVGDAHAELAITGVSTDSRAIAPGDLFVALRGPHFDGHAFVPAALEGGAAAALVARDAIEPAAGPVVQVDETLTALGDLAAAVLRDRRVRVVGITGSCGKTTAKNMTAAVLGAAYAVGATPGNLNNLVGVPLSVFRLPEACEIAVLELATSAPGEIGRLSEIVQPHVGVITNIAAAHLQGLGTLEGVRDAKAELLRGLAADGTLILNGDDPTTPHIRAQFTGRVVTFGLDPGAEVRATDVHFDADHRTHFRVNGQWAVELGLYGRAAIANALVAIAVGEACGIEPAAMAAALARVEPGPMRMQIVDRAGVSIINDAYNANPRSMTAAMQVFENGHFAGRKIAVFGDMLELGEQAVAEHEALGRTLAERDVDLVYTYGEYAEAVRAGAVGAGLQAERVYVLSSHADIVESLRYVLRAGDVVLVKGSRGMRMERVADGLLEAG